MELVLLDDVKKIGKKGDVVRVRDGYGRNFLLPRGLAIASSRFNKKFFDEQRVRTEKRRAMERAQAEGRVDEINKIKFALEARANEQGKLFGAVPAEQIVEELGKQGVEVEKKNIGFPEPIRSVGTFAVSVEIYPQVKATITVEIAAKS